MGEAKVLTELQFRLRRERRTGFSQYGIFIQFIFSCSMLIFSELNIWKERCIAYILENYVGYGFKIRIVIAKEAFNRKISLLTSKLNIELRKKLVRCYEEYHSLYRSPNIVRVIKSRRLRWAGHLARMEEGRSAFKI